jgi:hypothetical protein
MVIFNSYVSLPEGIRKHLKTNMNSTENSQSLVKKQDSKMRKPELVHNQHGGNMANPFLGAQIRLSARPPVEFSSVGHFVP